MRLLLCASIAAARVREEGAAARAAAAGPGPMSEVTVRRVGDDVQLRFKLPTANANGPGRIDLGRVEIYAVTVAPGTVVPPNRDLLTKTYAVATIAVKPPPVEGDGQPADGAPPDPRPSPGDEVSFVEQLTEARRAPAPLPKAVTPAVPQPGTAGAPLPAVAAVPAAAPCRPCRRWRSPRRRQREASPLRELALPASPRPPRPATVPAAPAPAARPRGPAAPAAATPGVPAAAAPAAPATTGAQAAPPAVAPAVQTPGAPVAAVPALPVQRTVVRIYAIRGLAASGRPGQPSARVTVPIVPAPPPPRAPKATFTETAVVVEWAPPEAAIAAPAPTFNVYRTAGTTPAAAKPAATKPAAAPPAAAAKAEAPLNPSPLAAARIEIPNTTLDSEQCFAIRTVEVVQNVSIESAASPPACVTPHDIFPPAAPAGLSLLLLDGAIELVWDASAEPDLAGYTVLRGDAPGDTLRPLTPSPIRETTFRDTTVRPGAHYTYAIVAVDRTGNASPPSTRVEGTAR